MLLEDGIVYRLSKAEIESELSGRLPQCSVICSLNSDGRLCVEVAGPDGHQFTIANIDRSQYQGEIGLSRLTREIMEEMVLSRQISHLSRARANLPS